MPINWPKYNIELKKTIDRLYDAILARKTPLLNRITTITIHEGDRSEIHHPNGEIQEMPMKQHEASYHFTDAELEVQGFRIVFDALEKLSDQMAEQAEKSVLADAKTLPPELGGVITGTKPEEIMERILQILSGMSVDFDDAGNPTSTTIVVNPQNASVLNAMEKFPSYRQRFEAILKRKHHEWRIRESNRRLAD